MNYNFDKAWSKDEHGEAFDLWNRMSKSYFKFIFGCFYENKYLINYLKKNPNLSLLDVGCGTGPLLRYIKLKGGLADYLGVDISESCIQRAQKIHKKNYFKKISTLNLSEQLDVKKYDIVYSRDTVPHQLEPLKFIKSLIDATKDILILRLRTRDLGSTIYDFEYSCQYMAGNEWVPYIVLNCGELIEFFKSQSIVKKIIMNKSYTILGGQNDRFIEKNLYLKKTGGAETTMIIFIDRNAKEEFKLHESTNIEGHKYLEKSKYKNFFLKILNKLSI